MSPARVRGHKITPATVTPPGKWNTLLFEDTFQGPLDTSKWTYDDPCFGVTGNQHHASVNVSKNVIFSPSTVDSAGKSGTGNTLKMRVIREPPGVNCGVSFAVNWTGGGINTGGKFRFTMPCRWETRCRIPRAKGIRSGVWSTGDGNPAGSSYVEIGLLEIFAPPVPDVRDNRSIFWSASGCSSIALCSMLPRQRQLRDYVGPTGAYDWIDWAFEWEDRHMAWYMNGVKFWACGDLRPGEPTDWHNISGGNASQWKWGNAAPSAGTGSPVYPAPYDGSHRLKLRINAPTESTLNGNPASDDDAITPSGCFFEVDYVRMWTY